MLLALVEVAHFVLKMQSSVPLLFYNLGKGAPNILGTILYVTKIKLGFPLNKNSEVQVKTKEKHATITFGDSSIFPKKLFYIISFSYKTNFIYRYMHLLTKLKGEEK
ncbi:hypothetical protein CAI16_12625 [Virgibacillus dokdonensis]|uniref:Uncharacterized protein n=1 Tax=Virgibacillus dokdonensis TaxID=302167 RepID=A0A3E0WM63_9BACI|nr:hypothetical protein CAI16_12625 [Virgibacillus dokdonensis]